MEQIQFIVFLSNGGERIVVKTEYRNLTSRMFSKAVEERKIFRIRHDPISTFPQKKKIPQADASFYAFRIENKKRDFVVISESEDTIFLSPFFFF